MSTVTRLLGLGLTPGKLRGLQRISNSNGTLTMVALDQNSSMINMMKDALKKKGQDREPTYQEIVEAKLELVRAFGHVASAVLIDAYYGAWSFVASGSVGKGTGLLIRVEKSGGPKNEAGAPIVEVEPGWSVGKIKRMGADAVKLLCQFEPEETDSAERNLAALQQIHAECQRHDILLLLEPVAFTFKRNGVMEDKKSKAYLDRKARTVIESARILSRLCDVYKAEFPGTLGHESDSQLMDNLKALNAASATPWVLLSAGVDYPEYKKQVEMAMQAGASGVLGGRAFWKEFFTFDSAADRQKFATQTGKQRVEEVHQIVTTKGKPWCAHYGLTLEEFAAFRAAEGWHARYGGGTATASRAAVAAGDVY